MFMFVLTLLILGSSVEQTSALAPTTALRFGQDLQRYMMLKLDMKPVAEAISVCSWVNKKTSDGHHDTWLCYNAPSRTNEIIIAGRIRGYAYMLRNHLDSNQAVPSNQWHHVCITWSYETKKSILYYDGRAIREEDAGSGKLTMGGTIAIGQFHKHADLRAVFFNNNFFGGELLKMNIYKRQLTAEEVGEMYASGMCSDYENTLIADAFLRWETVLYATERHGTITEVPITCPGDHWNVLYFDDFYNKVIKSDCKIGEGEAKFSYS